MGRSLKRVVALASLAGLGALVVAIRGRFAAPQEAQVPSTSWIVTGARILVPAESVLKAMDGLVILGSGARIQAIGTVDEVGPIPEAAVRIQGNGGTVLPGLVDCWCQLRDPGELDLALRAGVTTIRSMDSPDWLSGVLYRRQQTGIPTPRVIRFGGDLRRFASRSGFSSGGLEGEALVKAFRDDVEEAVKSGASGFTLGHDASREVLAAARGATAPYSLPLAIRSPGKLPFHLVGSGGDAIGSLETFFGDWLSVVTRGARRELRELPAVHAIQTRAREAVQGQRWILTGAAELAMATTLLRSPPEASVVELIYNDYGEDGVATLPLPVRSLANVAPLVRAALSQAAHRMRRSLPAMTEEHLREGPRLQRAVL
ncbi:MAG: hypothetical protein AAGG01_23975, partial [Planctomycetota bacterium]